MNTFKDFLLRHKIISLAVLVGVAYGAYSFFATEEEAATVVTSKPVTVTRDDVRVTVSGSGQIEANSQVDLKSVRAGDGVDILSVPVKNDQEVRKGQVIAVLDSGDVARTVEQSRLSLASAEIKLKQTADTYDRETKEDRWSRQLQELSVSQSRISLADAEEKLADYTIRAPFDGIVTGLSVEAGDSLSNETVIASVITKEMKVAISLNEVDAAKVKTGDQVTVSFNALPDLMMTGVISKLDTIGTTSSGVVSYGAEITLDEQNASLKPGMSVTAEITVAEKENVLVVPNSAISYEGDRTFVMLASGQKKEVVTGLANDTTTEIVSGLNEKESIQISTRTTQGTVGTSQGSTQGGGNILNSLFRSSNRNSR